MKYAAQFSKEVDLTPFEEILIHYDRQDRDLPIFLKKYEDKTVILQISNIQEFHSLEHWNLLNAIGEAFTNFIVCFSSFCEFHELNEQELECIQKLTVPFMLGNKVTNFDQLQYVLGLGVKSVYLAEDICFDLRRASRLCKRHGATVRVFANVAQSCIKQGPALKKFFVRPEDVEEYSDCIDVIEFWGPLNRQVILHKIYTKGFWYGDLNAIILGLNLEFDSRCIVPDFARVRKGCGRKCMRGETCEICDRIYEFSEKLKSENRGFNYGKKVDTFEKI